MAATSPKVAKAQAKSPPSRGAEAAALAAKLAADEA